MELSSQSFSSPWLALSSGSPPTLSLEVKKHAGGSGPLSLRPSLRGSDRPSSRGGRPLLVDQTCYPRNISKSFSAYKIDSLHSPRKRCAAHWDVLDPPSPSSRGLPLPLWSSYHARHHLTYNHAAHQHLIRSPILIPSPALILLARCFSEC